MTNKPLKKGKGDKRTHHQADHGMIAVVGRALVWHKKKRTLGRALHHNKKSWFDQNLKKESINRKSNEVHLRKIPLPA